MHVSTAVAQWEHFNRRRGSKQAHALRKQLLHCLLLCAFLRTWFRGLKRSAAPVCSCCSWKPGSDTPPRSQTSKSDSQLLCHVLFCLCARAPAAVCAGHGWGRRAEARRHLRAHGREERAGAACCWRRCRACGHGSVSRCVCMRVRAGEGGGHSTP